MPAFITAIPISPFHHHLHVHPLRHRHHRPRHHRPILALAQRLPINSAPSESLLDHLGTLTVGEWKGYEGRFTPSGNPIPIPDYYVPEEFAEWGLRPHGFESVHSVILRGNKLYRKLFRILPSVSLFADHVDTEEEFGYFEVDKEGVSVFEDGSWVRGEAKVEEKIGKLGKWPFLEVCVRHPTERSHATVGIKFDWAVGEVVDEVRVVLEAWECEYCDGADMDGGSGFVEGWVVEESVELDGMWESEDGDTVRRGVELPQGISFGVEKDEDVVVWVGWRVDDQRVVVRRRYDQLGHVQYTERLVQRKVG